MTAISFSDQVVIVTGAGNGLGRTYALDIASRGGAVIVNDLGGSVAGTGSASAAADAVVEEIRSAGGRAVASYDSVADTSGARRLAELAMDEFGRIDAVINNAGNMRYKPFEDFTTDDLQAVLAVHLTGAFNVSQAVWPHMKSRGYGRLVFTSSSTGMYGGEGYGCYGAAKAGVTGLMNVLAHEGEPHGVLCNTLMPNAITRMTDEVSGDMDTEELARAQQRVQALENAMKPTFNTGLAVYLASERCTSTRHLYSCCAGRIARVFVGVTEGWQGSRTEPATAEDVALHIREIDNLASGIHLPGDPGDEFRIVLSNAEPAIKSA